MTGKAGSKSSKRIILAIWLCIVLLSIPSLAQTTTVSGNVKTINPNLPPNTNGSYVEFALVNCGNNTPMVNGVAVLQSGPVDFYSDATGAITAAANGGIQPALYGNDVIVCGAGNTSRYSVRYFIGGVATGPAKFYYVSSTVPFNVSTATPVALLPPLIYPNTTVCPPGSYQSGLNRDLSVQCRNLPSGANDAIVTDPVAPQEIANQPLILDGPLISPSINTMLYSQASDTSIAAIEARCITVCTYMVTTLQAFTLTANHTLSSNVMPYFTAGGSWTINGSGFTLTISSQVNGTLSQHFSGTGGVKFGNQQSLVPVEWFGAHGDSTTDNTVAIQSTLDSLFVGQALLQLGTYKVSAPLSITHSGVGIKGTILRITSPTIYTIPAATEILSTSASADVIDVSGVSPSNTITFNKFEDFTVERSIVPTGTAAGISLNYTYGVIIARVGIQDSIRGIYVHGSGAQGSGSVEDSSIVFGYNGVTETSGSLYGIYLDSADGTANPSFRVRHSFAAKAPGIAAIGYGLYASGTEINDLMVYGFETATMDYGEYLVQTGVNSIITSSDIHFYGTINDGCHVSCIYISGLTASGGAGVETNGGYATTNGTNPLIDIENSSGVRVIGVQTGVAENALPSACIDVSHSADVTLTGNQCQGVRNVGILLDNSIAVAVTGNDLQGNGSVNGLINLTNSSLNSITGNVLTGTGLSMLVDVNSVNNTGLFDNPIAATLTPASIVGANPNAFGNSEVRTTIFRLGGSGSTWTQSAGAPTGTCINGSVASNSLTTTGTFPTYQCKNTAWVGLGTAY